MTHLDDFYFLSITFLKEDIELAEQTLHIAHTYAMTYYDACFIALALHLKSPLITAYPKHHKKYKEKDVTIISLKDYSV